ncbi:MFS domain-containing protein [Citrus sinensis]|uniref:MFS domain-containing protein n=1 Tax=Citrus sinensis TaxID=2711 RepID=A0ACB8JLR9_CITSI|nr:MFS domain-containing protein [Citrus sinensis]
MERADESLLPGVYKEVGAALCTDPTGLGSLTLFRSIVQSSCYPLAAYLSVHHNCAHIIALGAFLWAAATFLVAISTTFFQVAVSRGLNGIGLAIVTLAIQSLVADSTDESNRDGKSRAKDQKPHTAFWSEMKDLIKEAKMVINIPSFQIIVAQGVSGSFPWSALSFAPMWLELIGFSHGLTTFLMTLFTIAGSLGGLFGRWMGDTLAKRLPNSGRIILSQISSGSAIPIAAVLLLVLLDDPSTGFMHGLVLVIMGLCISWNAPATNKYHLTIAYSPIFAEIVPERSRTSIYVLDRSFESILASFAPPVVGLLAQNVYGYKPVPKGASNFVELETDRENAASLAKALYTAIGIRMTICCFIYSFLYHTYPRDRERARMDALIESEMQKLEADNAPASEKYSQRQFSESKELNEKKVTDIDIEHGGEESIDIDDNDKKSLLPHQVTFSNLQH